TNETHWPSVENAGLLERSVPVSAVTVSSPRRLSQSRPFWKLSRTTRADPSGDSASPGPAPLMAMLSDTVTYDHDTAPRADRARGRAVERRLAGEHLVQHAAQGVEVGLGRDLALAHGLLGSHVVRRT